MKQVEMGFGVDSEKADTFTPFDTIYGLPADEFRNLASQIVIALPHLQDEGVHGGLIEAGSHWSLAGSQVIRCEVPHSGFVEVNRAGIARRFLEKCIENPNLRYLLLIDTDESIPLDAPFRLAMWDRPVVSGVVCSVNPARGTFACFMVKDKNGVARFPSALMTGAMPAAGLKEVYRCGAGLMCIRKDVLEAIYQNNDIPFYLPDEVRRESCKTGVIKLGEDMRFCEQVKELGYKIYVDLAVHATHYKKCAIRWPEKARDPNLLPDDWVVSDKDYTF